MHICLAYYQARAKYVDKGYKEKMLDFSGISKRVAKIFAVLHSLIRTVSMELASLPLVGVIRCCFML